LKKSTKGGFGRSIFVQDSGLTFDEAFGFCKTADGAKRMSHSATSKMASAIQSLS
jgi:hypothetical protein